MNKSISFLIPAHNEEKIIDKALDNLAKLPYSNYEVLIGLDGCTDKTEEIVKKYTKKNKKFKYYLLELRRGKPEVVHALMKYAKGEIIIIHDADWVFRVNKKGDIETLLKCFDDPMVGGIAESFPLHIPDSGRSAMELGVIYSAKMWIDIVKENYAKRKGKFLVLDKNSEFPLLVNVFRRKLYKKTYTLADDFERCIDLINAGYEIYIPEDEKLPRMISYGEKFTFKGLLKQKERTALARKQLYEKYHRNYLLGKKSLPKRFLEIPGSKAKRGFIYYTIAFTIGGVINDLSKKKSTKEGWTMRIAR